jgi:hypothetical protein
MLKAMRLACVLASVAMLTAEIGTSPRAADDPPKRKKGDADGRNDRLGKARWEWKILDKAGKSTEVGTFTGYLDGSLKHGRKQERVGSFKYGHNKVSATFTRGPLQGELNLVMTIRKPVTYRGELVRADKTSSTVEVVIIND